MKLIDRSYLVLLALIVVLFAFSCAGDDEKADDNGPVLSGMGDVCALDTECEGGLCLDYEGSLFCSLACATDNDCEAKLSGSCCQTYGGRSVCLMSSECEVESDGDGLEPTRIFEIYPDGLLDFGVVESDQMPIGEVIVSNNGNTPFLLFNAAWENTVEDAFMLVDYVESIGVQPDGSRSFHVKLEPSGLGSVSNVLTINNDSDNEPAYELTVTAEIIAPQGNAEFTTHPEAVEFLEKPLGTPSSLMRVDAANAGGGTAKLYLVGAEVNNDGGAVFSMERLDGGAEITEESPVELMGGQGTTFSVYFDPDAIAEYGGSILFKYKLEDQDLVQTHEVAISGTAIQAALNLFPYPLNYGYVEKTDEKLLEVGIENTTAETINVRYMNIEGLNNWMDIFTFQDDADKGFEIIAFGHASFELNFAPDKEDTDYSCNLAVATDFEGNKTFYLPIVAHGGVVNQKPIAGISLESHGADMPGTHEVAPEAGVDFFGNISYDPDGDSGKLEYAWQLFKPQGSYSTITPSVDATNVSVYFDVAGTYMLSLVVTDEAGMVSDARTVNIIAGSNSNRIKIEMACENISGASDMDLGWEVPAGKVCDEENSGSGSCILPDPDNNGNVIVNASGHATDSGQVESITHTNPPDGPYKIWLTFDNNCPDSVYNCPFGVGEQDATCDIRIYVDDVLEYQIADEKFTDDGAASTRKWRMMRQSGTWAPPVEIFQ